MGRRSRQSERSGELSKTAYLFLAPALFLVGVFFLFPLAQTIYLSFTSWNGVVGTAPTYRGLANFADLWTDPRIPTVIWHNVLYMVLATGGTVLIGLLLASLLDMKVRGWRIFRGTFYLSVMIPAIVTGRLFVSLYSPYIGLINPIIEFLCGLAGLQAPTIMWLSDPPIVMFSIILKDVWQYAGFPMLLFIAGLSAIPTELYEAAMLEGASEWQIYWQIKLPMIRSVTAIAVVLQLIFSFRVFDTVWTMTQGGPGGSSEVLTTYLFKQAFQTQSFGYGSAIAIMMVLIIFPVAVVYLRLSKFGEL
jgi:raffinose/stachyose/melibiose transport system permease protein